MSVQFDRSELCCKVKSRDGIIREMRALSEADETPIRYLDPDVKGKSQQGYLWAFSRPKGDVLFEWRLRRSREGSEEFLRHFKGWLQTDGYYADESLAKERKGELTLVACWAHCRRGFHEALAES
jgi:transposase